MKLVIAAVLTFVAVLLSLNFLPRNEAPHQEVANKVELLRQSTSEAGPATQIAGRSDSSPVPPPPPTKKADNKEADKSGLRWETLRGLDYKTGKADKTVKKFLKTTVRIPGFVVPLDLYAKEAKEFLLVPTYGACIHTPPPPANQMILVKMKQGLAPRREAGPVWVTGQLELFKTETQWGKAGYRIRADMTEPYKGGY
ncbi:DUF3299 domain-containing protein [Pseudobacteriovorax antillogorgiicola]|uniref:DUF3299 domain-containing protein n=1 Tax=Pseudobacteriovorax antillogorgiicola TaxID=1513793 RepID=A0A1Y6BP60_9BACT|nr:DUF3299 domain-containing protein [Pseudobacteriovorax antillogorgiicola]TCS55543.1 hypothetical protein EDD56_105266 [Pseudobacteriovorax antillogorgiicola]SMF11169.1 hypothetical protein SAMN06296036_10558 [Pseudobacteriovorax antillogorgiicola]